MPPLPGEGVAGVVLPLLLPNEVSIPFFCSSPPFTPNVTRCLGGLLNSVPTGGLLTPFTGAEEERLRDSLLKSSRRTGKGRGLVGVSTTPLLSLLLLLLVGVTGAEERRGWRGLLPRLFP